MSSNILEFPSPRAKWAAVERVYSTYFYDPPVQAIRAVYSAMLAHLLDGHKVWMMCVAPPGSMKTEVLMALKPTTGFWFTDTLTPNTLLSGQIRKGSARKMPSLLHRIGSQGFLVLKDFSTLIEKDPKAVKEILGQLRTVYDGDYEKEVGTSEEDLKWHGRLTMITACTPEIDNRFSTIKALGERFLMVRWSRAGGEHHGMEAARMAMRQNPETVKNAVSSAVKDFFATVAPLAASINPTVPIEIEDKLTAMGEFTTCARSHVSRDGFSKELDSITEPESATRFSQQFCQLAKGSALIDGRSEVNADDWLLARRVARDCLPLIRKRAIDALVRYEGQSVETISDEARIPRTSLQRTLEDLHEVGIANGTFLSPQARKWLEIADVVAPKVTITTNIPVDVWGDEGVVNV